MRTVTMTAALVLFWNVVVPPEGWVDVVVGAVASLALAVWAARFLWPHAGPHHSSLHMARVPGFALLTAKRIVIAAAQVLRIVMDPRLPIEPFVVRQTVHFDEEAARVVYANAITITPGTLTLDVDGDAVTVHALGPELARDVVDGTLARDVARLFERRQPS
ncbi:MAG: Na+/H+ antiporter subunit E [Trueperaceae bacterium]